MNEELRKTIYIQSRLRKKICKNPPKDNELALKKQRNICESFRKKGSGLPKSKSLPKSHH